MKKQETSRHAPQKGQNQGRGDQKRAGDNPLQEGLHPLNILRTETVLSRLPIHNLSKKGGVDIQILEKNESGQIRLFWEVSYNSRFGQPGPLAYKIETLVVNRRLDEANRPTPRIIRLGSLREIGDEVGIGAGNTNPVKKALRQNAFAGITAKFVYKGRDEVERTIDISDTRYGVIFTGETLPDGQRADAVYLVLHDFYREILNTAPDRPLNYDYLKQLTPGHQRFYEILSYQIYAALCRQASSRRVERARLRYSEYCTYSTQVRCFDREPMRKQMLKVHKPHLESGYITKVDIEPTTDQEGRPDWDLFYTPGPKAKADHLVFTKRGLHGERQQVLAFDGPLFSPATPTGPAAASPAPPQVTPTQANLRQPATAKAAKAAKTKPQPEPLTPEQQSLFTELTQKFLVSEEKARKLVTTHLEAVNQQLTLWPHRREAPKNLAGWIIGAIEKNYPPPHGYLEKVQQQAALQERAAQKAVQQSRQEAHRQENIQMLCALAAQMQREHPGAFAAFEEHIDIRKAQLANSPIFPKLPTLQHKVLAEFDTELKRLELFIEFFRANPCPLPPLVKWLRAHNEIEARELLQSFKSAE